MNAAHQRRLTPVLGGLLLVLGAGYLLLLAGAGSKPHWARPRPPAALPPPISRASLPLARPLQEFAPVWQKPLFSPDRKPTAHAVDGGSNLGDFTLTGIVLTPGLHMALLHAKQGDREIRLREGQSLPDGSVTLVEVRPRSALFDAAGGRTELKLPAGAVIDVPRAEAPGGMPAGPPGNAMMRVNPAPDAPPRQVPAFRIGGRALPGNASPSLIDRLREQNQRRRAARAAATH